MGHQNQSPRAEILSLPKPLRATDMNTEDLQKSSDNHPISPQGLFRSPSLLHRQRSSIVLIDVQERFLPVIRESERVLKRCRQLLEAAQLFEIPIAITEQYPKGLGRTASDLQEFVTSENLKEKLTFSAAPALNWSGVGHIDSPRDQVVLCGIETHVCVLQTAFDLLSWGYTVFVIADAVSSRTESDTYWGLERMMLNGVHIASTESVLFEWCEAAGTPEFRRISQIVKE